MVRKPRQVSTLRTETPDSFIYIKLYLTENKIFSILMLYRVILAMFCENYTKCINLIRNHEEVLNVKIRWYM